MLISKRPADLEFWSDLSVQNGIQFHCVQQRKDLQQLLVLFPQSIVVWDVDHDKASDSKDPYSTAAIGEVIGKICFPSRVFAVTDKALGSYAHLFIKPPPFNHHLYRSYGGVAKEFYPKLITNCFIQYPFGLRRFFAENIPIKKISLRKSGHKRLAVEALNRVLVKKEIRPRLAGQIARAIDEIIMNAIFDAPQDLDRVPVRRQVSRDEDFSFGKNEQISLEFCGDSKMMGISVADQYGTFQRDIYLRLLKQNYSRETYIPRKWDPGAGLGVYGIVQTGLSLLITSKPEVRTEVTLLFPMTSSYRELREGFHFQSFLSDSPPPTAKTSRV